MHLTKVLSTLAVGAATISRTAADADFLQVRRKLAMDQSKRETDSPEKYFRKFDALSLAEAINF